MLPVIPIPNSPELLLPQVYKWSFVPSLVMTDECSIPKDTCLIAPLSLRDVTSWGIFLLPVAPIPNWPSLLCPQVYKWSFFPSLVMTDEEPPPKDTC